MSQRQRANTQDRKTLMAAWQDIPWKKVQRHVFRLQKRMYRATQRGDVSIVRKLQNLLCKSWYARLFAVRRVTQDNRGKHTAGIDGVKSLIPPQRLRLAHELRLTSKATPLRRTWIPKRGSPEGRPLGIRTLHERARQTLVRQALEPEWEAKLAPHTYGFRPGRSCWDAIAAVFHRMKFRPQYIVRSLAGGTPRLQAIGVLTMEIGCIGAPDGDATQQSAPDWPRCSNDRADVVPTVGCSSNMLTRWRLTTSAGIDESPAMTISKPYYRHCLDAKTREHAEYLPAGLRDKHQDTEERSARKRARSVLEQR